MKWLVHLYPREWRERYGEEFSAVLDSQRHAAWTMVDIVRGALDAHVNRPWPQPTNTLQGAGGGSLMLIRGDRPGLLAALLLMPVVFFEVLWVVMVFGGNRSPMSRAYEALWSTRESFLAFHYWVPAWMLWLSICAMAAAGLSRFLFKRATKLTRCILWAGALLALIAIVIATLEHLPLFPWGPTT